MCCTRLIVLGDGDGENQLASGSHPLRIDCVLAGSDSGSLGCWIYSLLLFSRGLCFSAEALGSLSNSDFQK